jgi:hypothetical protein
MADKSILPTTERSALAKRIRAGRHTEADRAAMRKLMLAEPERFRDIGDLCEWAFERAVEHYAGKHTILAESIKGQRDILRADFGYADALPPERLLIDEIALSRLRHYQAVSRHERAGTEPMPLATAEYWEKKVSSTQRRYLRAIETLARVGKLLRSVTVQLNIGEKQLNVAGGNVVGAVACNGPAPNGTPTIHAPVENGTPTE